jgi:hypothetical protein
VDFSNDLSAFATRPPSLRSVLQLGFRGGRHPRIYQSNRTRAEDPMTTKPHLADYHLPNPVIEACVTTFYLKGKFVLARTESGKNRGYAAFASHVSSIPGYRRVDLNGVEAGVGKLRRVHLAETWDPDHLEIYRELIGQEKTPLRLKSELKGW